MAPRVDDAWAPDLWGQRILFWTAYAPYILSSRDAGYRSALLNTLARGARHLDAQRRQGRAGPAADHRLGGRGRRRAGRPGRAGAADARRSRADARAVGGAVRGWRADQPLARTSRCCWSTGSASSARPISRPSRRCPTRSKAPPPPRSPRFMASPWATARCRAGRAATRRRRSALAALVEGCGLRARPLRAGARLGLSAAERARHGDRPRRRPAAAAAHGRRAAAPRPWPSRSATARSGWSSIAAAPAIADRACRAELVEALRTTAAHSTLILDDPIRPRSCPTAASARASPRSSSTAARTMTARGSRPATTAMSAASAWSTSAACRSATTARKCAARTCSPPRAAARSANRRPSRSASTSRPGSSRPSPPTGWARSCARPARRRGSSAAAGRCHDRGKPGHRRRGAHRADAAAGHRRRNVGRRRRHRLAVPPLKLEEGLSMTRS